MRASSEAMRDVAIGRLARLSAADVEVEGEEVRLRPRSVEGARRAIALAAEHGLGFGQGLRLDRSGLSHVGLIDPHAMWIHCGPGAKVAAVEHALSRAGLTLGSQPPSIFGGTVAEWLEGPFAGRRAMDGRLESGVAALEAVLPDGTALATRAAPRSAAGPAVGHLILGGGGACGLVLGATLKAQPAPRKRELLAWEGEPAKLAGLLQWALQRHLPPWEAAFCGPRRMELSWPTEREDQRVALQCFRRRAAEAGARPAAALSATAGNEVAECATGELPAFLAALEEEEPVRLHRLARESVVVVGRRVPEHRVPDHGTLLHRIAALLRP